MFVGDHYGGISISLDVLGCEFAHLLETKLAIVVSINLLHEHIDLFLAWLPKPIGIRNHKFD